MGFLPLPHICEAHLIPYEGSHSGRECGIPYIIRYILINVVVPEAGNDMRKTAHPAAVSIHGDRTAAGWAVCIVVSIYESLTGH